MVLARRTRRRIALTVLLFLGLLPFLVVVGGGLYLRSDVYRHATERRLTAFFGLPTRVGRVIPLSLHERELRDIEIFLPDHNDPSSRVAWCRRARWIASTTAPGRFDLILSEGELDLTPARWARGDFRRLEQSLRHDYPDLDLNQVGISRASVRWGRGDFAIELSDAEGTIAFDPASSQPEGRAMLRAGRLNGRPAAVEVRAILNALDGTMDGEAGLVRSFSLRTRPERLGPIPLAQFRLDPLVGRAVRSGQFTGTLEYVAAQGERRHVFTVRDATVREVQLAELTPLAGRVDLRIHQLQFEQSAGERGLRVRQLDVSGNVADFELAPAMRAAGLPPCGGRVDLQLERAAVEPGQPIREISLTGRADRLDLNELTALLPARFHNGRMRGQARLSDIKLAVRAGRLVQAEADLAGLSSPEAALIDLSLIEAAVPSVASVRSLYPGLPEAISYRDLHVRLANSGPDGGLLLIGLGGDDKRSIMTLLIPTPGAASRLVRTIAFNARPGDDGKPIPLKELSAWLAQPVPPIELRAVGRTVRDVLGRPTSQPTSQP